ISIDPSLKVKMGKTNLEYTAQFVYAPDSPRDPGTNSWNRATGELIVDDFNPGSLWSRVCDLVKDEAEKERVTSITVIGKMDDYDFGVVRNLPSLVMADFSRTDGATTLPWGSMEQIVALTKVVLPPSVARIEPYAFSGCSSLSELVCYSSLPPDLGYDVFNGVPDGLVVKVYASSLNLYQGAQGWNNYRVIPIDEESTVLRVFLPEDASEGWYVNSSLQLDNLSTGRSQKLVVTKGRDSYLFGNLIPDLKYSLYALAPNGETIGKRLDFIVTSAGEDFTFTSLLHPYPVKLALLTPDGEDMADKAEISWSGPYGNFLASGKEIQGQVEGSILNYKIGLSNDLATTFQLPEEGKYEVKKGDNLISVNLIPLK
ncbi:MAG: leucine-rich repeat domain-containing protein, partial [Muribaculaceae bacterium]|nr:leucine-rich repeat domain-containing protein [Muribaculaceae bacterium]